MTTTLTLLCGAGIGALLATIILIALMWRVSKATTKANEETKALMKERNRLDYHKIEVLDRIAKALEGEPVGALTESNLPVVATSDVREMGGGALGFADTIPSPNEKGQ